MNLKEMPEVSERLFFHGIVPKDENVLPVGNLGEGLVLVDDRKGELDINKCYSILELPEFIVNNSNVDRNLRDSHVSYLINAMKRKTFHPEWVQIITCYCKESGKEYRMNGQHCTWARLEMPENYSCKVRFIKYEAETIHDMRVLYASIDRNAPRTTGNIINSYLSGTEQFSGATQKMIKSFAAGLNVWLTDDESRHDADDVAFQIQTKYKDLTIKIKDYLIGLEVSTTQKNIAMRSSVMASLYETFNKLPNKAADFWNPVLTGLNFDGKTDPRFKLHNGLRESIVSYSSIVGRNKTSGKRSVTVEEMYRWGVVSWNAWRKGENMLVLRANTTGKRPKAK